MHGSIGSSVPGRINALAQKLLCLTCPGVPDIYQGTDLWNLSLVDPDNRRPVDWETHRRVAASVDVASATAVARGSERSRDSEALPGPSDVGGAAQTHPDAFAPEAPYMPLEAGRARRRPGRGVQSWRCHSSPCLDSLCRQLTRRGRQRRSSFRPADWSRRLHRSRAISVASPSPISGRGFPVTLLLTDVGPLMRPEVWAPAARSVQVDLDGSRAADGTRSRDARVVASASTDLPPGTDYRFVIDGGPRPRRPPQPPPTRRCARAVPGRSTPSSHGPTTAGVGTTTRPRSSTRSTSAPSPRRAPSTRAIRHLDHLVALGVTAVEVMPVASFPGRHGWGYDGVDLWSVHEPYGGPDGLKRFVDACHHHGLGVILDVVYNHLGPDGNALGAYGPYFTDRHADAVGRRGQPRRSRLPKKSAPSSSTTR